MFLEKIRDSLIIGKGQKTSRKSLSKGQLPIVKITRHSESLTHKLLIAYCIYLENALLRSYRNLLSQENVIENADSGFLKKPE